ncbi:MAG: DUF1489 family protein [Candidatus Puniceispirillaceae bacterium]
MTVHLKKLSVGAVSIDSMRHWQNQRLAAGLPIIHPTRNWPRRKDELLDGGSLYWIIKGQMLARQAIDDMIEVTNGEGDTRCGIVLNPEIVPVMPRKMRIFQGWRYLEVADAPDDMPFDKDSGDALPAEMAAELRDLGLL